ncbi:uncharacterized protein PV06_04028 [Exophiala oligosperma]|uniref:Uncharacterized protein n=1 Tax=Exophiala oligosperma TaxID=215243 RepID=A0A0D2B0N2_9EURO|nr:uncharacterized protein PV06_04028 [Exophiala oligosperma]KIW45656.1 hypothetical protein PV06_04028 [Exophiala oligosperma]
MVTKFLDKLRDKRVLIIGGTSGIGYGLAEGCVEFGATVILASRSRSKVDEAVARLRGAYPERAGEVSGHTVNLDGGRPEIEEELTELFEFATDHHARKLDHVVETAGDLALMGKVTMDNVTPDLLGQLAGVRLFGVTMLAKVAARYLAPAPGSSFTMTSGVLVFRPRKGMGAMVGVGAGKEGLTRGLAVDMAPARVNTVSPGASETDLLFAQVPPEAGEEGRDRVREMYGKMSLVGKTGQVGDIAEAYLALMRSGFQTGTIVHVEGGFLLM